MPIGVLKEERFVQDELVYKKIWKSEHIISFILTTQNNSPELTKPNPFNEGGYRYFCGVTIPEVSNYAGKTIVCYSTLYFETFLPFTSLFRDIISVMLAEIKIARMEAHSVFMNQSSWFRGYKDYEAIGSAVTDKYFYKETHPVVGLLPLLYWADIYKGISIQRAGQNVDFKADILSASTMHSLEAINLLPGYITPWLILLILGAVLQECVVVIHGSKRKVCYDIVSFVLSLISPVCWPYPVIPLLSGEMMEEFTDSPVPLICTIEEDPDIFEQKWTRRS